MSIWTMEFLATKEAVSCFFPLRSWIASEFEIVCLARDVDIETAEHMAREPAEPPLCGPEL